MKQIDSIRLLQKIAIAANEATVVEEALQACLDEEQEQLKEIRSLSITDIFSKPIDPGRLFKEVEKFN